MADQWRQWRRELSQSDHTQQPIANQWQQLRRELSRSDHTQQPIANQWRSELS